MTHPRIDHQQVEDMILQLGEIGRHADTGVWRTAFSPEWVAANEVVAGWARVAGLEVDFDAGGNLWSVAQGCAGGPSVVTGSHIDSQCPGGRYDGALGIIAGMVAVGALVAQYGPPKRTLEVVSLCEEEGSRFPTAGFWGSRAIVGQAGPEACDSVRDAQGISIGAAMTEVGFDPDRIGDAARTDIAAFVELHIEQGPILEDADLPVAIVDAITHIRQTEVTLHGVSNHAGAFPMDIRNDPMAGFAEIASGVIAQAEALGRPAVSTIGHCVPEPGGRAIIPRSVTFTIDARHPDPKAAEQMYAAHAALISDVAARRGLRVSTQILLDHPSCQSDPALVSALDAAAARMQVPVMHMASGAGHDAQQMAQICPVAMLFVRSFEGRSHTPEEFSALSDCVAGIQVLAAALYDLAY